MTALLPIFIGQLKYLEKVWFWTHLTDGPLVFDI